MESPKPVRSSDWPICSVYSRSLPYVPYAFSTCTAMIGPPCVVWRGASSAPKSSLVFSVGPRFLNKAGLSRKARAAWLFQRRLHQSIVSNDD
jgi:hypothetical protein